MSAARLHRSQPAGEGQQGREGGEDGLLFILVLYFYFLVLRAVFLYSELCRDSEQLEKSAFGGCFALSIPLSHNSNHGEL